MFESTETPMETIIPVIPARVSARPSWVPK